MTERHHDSQFSSSARALGVSIDRRSLLKRSAVLGLSVPIVATLIAACADDDDDDVVDDGVAATEDDDDEDSGDDDAEELADDTAAEDPADDDEAAAPSEGGTARIVMPQVASDPTTMHPLFTASGAEQALTGLHFGGLLKMNDAQEVVPDLVEDFEISEDAIEFTFHILEDAEWSDGEPVTSDDAVFTFECFVDPEIRSPLGSVMQISGARAYSEGDADSIEGVSAPDEKTVVVELEAPNAVWALNYHSLNARGLVPRHIYEGIERSQLEGHELSMNPEVGAGAFLLTRWESEQFMEFTANENYVHGAPILDSIQLLLMQPDVALAELEIGNLDVTHVPFNELERTQGFEGVEVTSAQSPSLTALMVNTSQPYLTVGVRQAISYAIDRQGIVEAVFQGLGQPQVSAVIGPDWMGDVEVDADLNLYEYDPDRAREILEEEGWDPDQTVEFQYATDHAENIAAWTLIQSNLQDVGIDLELRQLEFAAKRQNRDEGNFDLNVLQGGIPAVEPHDRLIQLLPMADGSDNTLRYRNDELTALIEEGLTYTDPEDRREIYLQAAQITNEELPQIWLWSPHNIFAKSDRLQGFLVPGHMSNVVWNANEWSVNS